MHEWFQTPPGRYLLEWERDQFDRAVADIFGYHALQLGMPDLDALGSNRMPHRWLALDAAGFAASGGTAAVDPTGSRDEVGDTAAASRLALRAEFLRERGERFAGERRFGGREFHSQGSWRGGGVGASGQQCEFNLALSPFNPAVPA